MSEQHTVGTEIIASFELPDIASCLRGRMEMWLGDTMPGYDDTFFLSYISKLNL